jgi:lipopolysaccharide export system ATP-binding protein
MADTLSGGEQRRLELCRALATRPLILLLDEPFAGVDPIAVSEIQSLVEKMRTKNIGILITDHNVRETLQSTDRAYIIHQGRIEKEGTPRELVADPRVREVYLGHTFDRPGLGVSSAEERDLIEP